MIYIEGRALAKAGRIIKYKSLVTKYSHVGEDPAGGKTKTAG